MRRSTVVALLALCAAVPSAAAGATTTGSGTYSGTTAVLSYPGEPPCLELNGINHCAFESFGPLSGQANGSPWSGGYEAHLRWVPIQGCAPVTGEIWLAEGWSDPPNMSPPLGGNLRAVIDP